MSAKQLIKEAGIGSVIKSIASNVRRTAKGTARTIKGMNSPRTIVKRIGKTYKEKGPLGTIKQAPSEHKLLLNVLKRNIRNA